jgi:hypothetical protein
MTNLHREFAAAVKKARADYDKRMYDRGYYDGFHGRQFDEKLANSCVEYDYGYQDGDGDRPTLDELTLDVEAACSLCGEPSGIEPCGAAWYLCMKCEDTPEAKKAGYVHDHSMD